MSASSQEMVKTPDRFRINMPFGNPDVGLKNALFDKVPTDITPQQEEIVGDAAALVGQMLRRDALTPERSHFLRGNSQLQQLSRDQYADLGDGAEAAYKADVQAEKDKTRAGGYVVMTSSREAWSHGAESAPAVVLMTTRPANEQDAVGYELKLMGNSVGGSPYNAEVLPNVVPGITSVTIAESGAISMRTHEGKVIDAVSEEQGKYIRNLLVKLQGKVQQSTEQIARGA